MPKKDDRPLSAKDVIYYYQEAKRKVKWRKKHLEEAETELEDLSERFLTLRQKIRDAFNGACEEGLDDDAAYKYAGDKFCMMEEEVKDLLKR